MALRTGMDDDYLTLCELGRDCAWREAPGALYSETRLSNETRCLCVCLSVRNFRHFPRRAEVLVTFNDSLHLSRVRKNNFQKKSQDFDHSGQRYVSRGTPVLSSFWSTFSSKVKTATSPTSEITVLKLCIGKRIRNAGPRERQAQPLPCGSHLV